MFKWLNKTGVESDRGFAVQSMDRFTIEYREGDRKIDIYVERGLLPDGKYCVTIEAAAFEHWNGDPEWVTLPPEKQDEMLANFTEAMEFQGLAVVVSPPA
ncbi:MAG: hypothetical protein ACLQLG_07490 [Thermoguttaceae bacterium]